MEAAKSLVDNLLSSKTPVVIISKTFCPYCTRVKEALSNIGVPKKNMTIQEINEMKNMNEIQDYMQQITGARSVPRVFIQGKFVGGCDDVLKALENGSLQKLLTEANAFS